jgi:membrane protease YdiL (CAAX protease family)
VLVVFVVTQHLVSRLVHAICLDGSTPEQAVREVAVASFAGAAVAAVVALGLSWMLVGRDLLDCGVIGGAWVLGSRGRVALGFVLGAVLGFLVPVVTNLLLRPPQGIDLGVWADMAISRGLPAILWIAMVGVVAPIGEELVFRGVLFGGLSKALGAVASGVVVTLLFAGAHLVQLTTYWQAVLPVLFMGIAFLAMRVWSRAVGPAVAMHFGYNLVLIVTIRLYVVLGNPG